MRRRDFIRSTAFAGAGLIFGLPGDLSAFSQKQIGHEACNVASRGFTYPRGGCTESGIALFDKGPFGRDPFSVYC